MTKQTRINWENKIKHPIKGSPPDEVQPVVKARVNRTKRTETPPTNKAREDEITRRK